MQRNRKFVTLALLIATFLAAIEGTIVSTATAAIASDLEGVSLVNWIFSIYLLLMSVTTPIFGKLSDIYGRRFIFTFGTVIFLLGSTLCGLAQSMEQLIGFRAIQGLGAGAVIPMTTTIAGDIYPYRERAKILGLFSAIWGISGVIAPLLGGFLVDYLSWHWIFYCNLPFGLISLLLLWMFFKENMNKKERKQIDYLGTITFTISMTTFLLAILLGGTFLPWLSKSMIGLLITAVLFFILFLRIETKAADPMLPLSLFKMPSILYANITGFLISIILIGINIYLPIWIQGIHGYGATGAGLALAPLSIGWVIGSNTVGSLLVKLTPRKMVLMGMTILFFSTFCLTLLRQTSDPWFIGVITFIMGIGFGYCMTMVILLGQSGIENQLRGIATAINTFIRTLGQTVGAAIFGAIFNYFTLRQVSGTTITSIEEIKQILRPETSRLLSGEMITQLREVLFQSVHLLFWGMVFIALFSFFIGWKIPHQQPEE